MAVPPVFLVSIKITGTRAVDCRAFAKDLADAVERAFEEQAKRLEPGPHTKPNRDRNLTYELNLTKWEPL